MAVFCVNKSIDEDLLLSINMLGLEDYKPFEYTAMESFGLKQENTFNSVTVRPKNKPLPVADGTSLEIKLDPLSWNVIRLKK